MPLMTAQINPLRCFAIDPPIPGMTLGSGAEALLDYLFDPDAERTADAFGRRYREVASIPAAFFVAPAEPKIQQKLLWPLRHAIGSYCLADHLGCIALCGMVGEMVAILLWEISPVLLANRPLDANGRPARLFEGEFENLGQKQRTRGLHRLRLIDDATKAAFDSLREIRRTYLHFFSKGHDSLEADARKALGDAASIVAFLLDLSIPEPGVVSLRPELMAYVSQRVPLQDTDATQSDGSEPEGD